RWFEVKPSEDFSEKDREKISRFQETDSKYMLLIGDPSDDMTVLINGGDHVHEVFLTDCPCCGEISICEKSKTIEFQTEVKGKSRFREAVLASRSARFEHGDTPKVRAHLRPPAVKSYVNSLGDGGERDYWIESEYMPGEVIYFCGSDKDGQTGGKLAEQIVEAHNSGDFGRERCLARMARTAADVYKELDQNQEEL